MNIHAASPRILRVIKLHFPVLNVNICRELVLARDSQQGGTDTQGFGSGSKSGKNTGTDRIWSQGTKRDETLSFF